VRDLALRYRVSEDRVRRWITTGALRAVNRRDKQSARPSWVVTAEALAEFECARAATPPPKPTRRPRRTQLIDYYAD
jgi:hypothetical protein